MPLPIIGELTSLMPDTVTVREALTFDGYGNPATFGSPVNYRALIIGRTVIVRDSTGREQTSNRHAIIAGTGFKVRDEFTLPARFQPQQPVPLSIKYSDDENGPHHAMVYF